MTSTSKNTVSALLATATLTLLPHLAYGREEGRSTHAPGPPAQEHRLRELSADRPDATESAQTVDAGHVQIETEIASYLRDRSGGHETRRAYGGTNLKFGLRRDLDVGIVFTPLIRMESGEGSAATVDHGFSNLQLRLKWNLWGNDGEKPTALALLPFVVVPLGGDSIDGDDWAGGLIVPFAWDCGEGWSFGTQVGFEVGRESPDPETRVAISHTIVVGRELLPRLSGFLEFASLWPTGGDAGWSATVNAGLVLGIHEDLQFDFGVAVGVNREAPDFAIFAGFTLRI